MGFLNKQNLQKSWNYIEVRGVLINRMDGRIYKRVEINPPAPPHGGDPLQAESTKELKFSTHCEWVSAVNVAESTKELKSPCSVVRQYMSGFAESTKELKLLQWPNYSSLRWIVQNLQKSWNLHQSPSSSVSRRTCRIYKRVEILYEAEIRYGIGKQNLQKSWNMISETLTKWLVNKQNLQKSWNAKKAGFAFFHPLTAESTKELKSLWLREKGVSVKGRIYKRVEICMALWFTLQWEER